MQTVKVIDYISDWLKTYANNAGVKGFIIGISGGIDSAVTSTLCARTGLKLICLEMDIHQNDNEVDRGLAHINWLEKKYANVSHHRVNLTDSFETIKASFPEGVENHGLSMANTRARLRMTTLYAVGQANGLLVAGTGNKVEDFGVGFYTKYGDGGVDLSPIADLFKSEVFAIAKELDIVQSIQNAAPTDGLWKDERTDEGQIGATYPELEWAMTFEGNPKDLTDRQKEVIKIYHSFHRANKHKMVPIPICEIPENLK
ncbi:NAD(+) synthase [Putridiphycobacter roseus]|uniref:NH(3)-dependent NAD(+) synthetase n=1 Tax=Putridiphycobacter roseus TaxID=2219161 RepID=A0A2W1MWG1_9FLAO|nr:NAD(+) synthase [Putridiphycobacter roseus]PZE16449.1 NAD(+) synthase [Putridiphycobacter roseus]